MITINAAPSANKIILDANNTIISITSNNGIGYYFRALIYIDGVLFDEQSWSRKDAYTSEKDLKRLYYAYYETTFNPSFTNGLNQQTDLIKRVSITINEHLISDDSIVQTQSFDDFYIMYNCKPIAFNDDTYLEILAIKPSILQVPLTGKISIPFYVNSNNNALYVTLTDDSGNIIDTQTIAAFIDKRVYLYNYDLATTALSNILYLTITITVGVTTLSKNLRVFNSSKYPLKEIIFLNNFGYWIYAYLDGQLLIENALDTVIYEELDTTEKVYEINEKQTYTIATGSLLQSEKDIINQIAIALESKIVINSEFIKMINATKKLVLFQDRKNLYAENLSFSVKQNNAVANPLVTTPPAPKVITITSIVPGIGELFTIDWNANFIPEYINPKFSFDNITFTDGGISFGTNPLIAPLHAEPAISGHTHFFCLIEALFSGTTINSNIFEYPVFVAPTLISATRTIDDKVDYVWNNNGMDYNNYGGTTGTTLLQYSIDSGTTWITSNEADPDGTGTSSIIVLSHGTPIWYRIVLFGNGYSSVISNVLEQTF